MAGKNGWNAAALAAAFAVLGAGFPLLAWAVGDGADPRLWAGFALLLLLGLLLLRRQLRAEAAESDRWRLQAEIAEAKDALDLLLAENPTVIYSAPADTTGRAAYLSPNLGHLLGTEAEVALRQPGWWLSSLHPDDRPSVEATLDSARWPQGRIERTYRFRHADGRWRWLEDHCRRLPARRQGPPLLIGSLTDVTARIEAEERLRKIALNLPGAIFQYRLERDGSGYFPYASEAAWRVCGLRPDEAAFGDGAFFAAVLPADLARLRLSRLESATRLQPWQVEFRLRHPARGEIWIELRAIPEAGDEDATLWHGFMTDVTRRKSAEAELQRLATTDPLTGLANRRRFFERGAEELQRARRYRHPLTVVMLDLDRFKAVNDRYGHEAGDAVLRELARRLGGQLRPSDLAGRLGGEEFALLLPETAGPAAVALAERLRAAVAGAPLGPSISVTASFGVAELEEGDEDLDAALARADKALYRAKAAGRNRVELQAVAAAPVGADAVLPSPHRCSAA